MEDHSGYVSISIVSNEYVVKGPLAKHVEHIQYVSQNSQSLIDTTASKSIVELVWMSRLNAPRTGKRVYTVACHHTQRGSIKEMVTGISRARRSARVNSVCQQSERESTVYINIIVALVYSK